MKDFKLRIFFLIISPILLFTITIAQSAGDTEEARAKMSNQKYAPDARYNARPSDGASGYISFAEAVKRAESGDAAAQHILGKMYYLGSGAPNDLSRAFEWLEKAASQGNAGAQSLLGFMYFNGEGVAINKIKAFEWYEKAALRGDAGAQFNSGLAYKNGEGVAADRKKAYAYFSLSEASCGTEDEAKMMKAMAANMLKEMTGLMSKDEISESESLRKKILEQIEKNKR